MVARAWRVGVTPLGGGASPGAVEVKASNWMGALKAARLTLGEEEAVPPGASCAVAPDGTVTVLDAASRRRFTLQPVPKGAGARAAPTSAEGRPEPPRKKRPLSRTVAMIPDERDPPPEAKQPTPAQANAQVPAHAQALTPPATPVLGQPDATRVARPRRKFETVAFSMNESHAAARQIVISDRPPAPGPASPPTPAQVSVPKPKRDASPETQAAARSDSGGADREPPPVAAPLELTLLIERDEEPTSDNPLTYRERVYVVPAQTRASKAEVALRARLGQLKEELESVKKGKFVNLAVFDHAWTGEPKRPPLVVLSWKDWRGEPQAEYPAVEHSRRPLVNGGAGRGAERLAFAFEALQDLGHVGSAAEASQLVIELLDKTIPSEAASACLYDIDTDELRFVATSGLGADGQRGQAVSGKTGLLGQALRRDGEPMVVGDVLVEPAYNPESDSRPGIEDRNMLLRALSADSRTLGLIQLINRAEAAGFSKDDVNVLNYIADQLAASVHRLRRGASIGK